MHHLKKKLIVYFLACLSIILLSSPKTFADTYVGGIINTDTTWTIEGSPYNITSFIEIASGKTLTIEPGVTINGSGVYIGVWGTLNAIGNNESKIIFNNTPIIGREDNENGNFLINVQFAIFYGGYISPNNSPTFGSMILKDSELYNTTEIIHLWYPREDTYIERNIFNDAYGIYFGVSPNKKVYIKNNVFYVSAERNQNQGYHAIRNFSNYDDGSTIENNSFLSTDRIVLSLSCLGADSMNAKNNFWNTIDINVIDNMIYDKKDTIGACNYINYIPFLTSAHPDTPILKHLVTINKIGSGTGIVTSNPFGINCGNDCLEAYNQGTVVTLTATPAADSVFSNWSGDYIGSTNPTIITMTGNTNITANFNQNCDHSLTIVVNPSGSGTVTKNPDKANYCPNEQVTLTANPNTGYSFTSWSGVDSSSGMTAQVTTSNNKTVTANFSQINYTLSLSKTGNGSVMLNGTIHTLPWSGQFPSGTEVQVEAVADSGWNFSSWSGDFTGSTNPMTITISANKNTTVNFSQSCIYSLNININPPGSGTVTRNPDKANYCNDEQVILTANPSASYNFSSWSGVNSSNGVTAQVTMSSNKAVTADFSQIPVVNYTLSLSKSGSGSVKVNGTIHTLPWSGQFPSGTEVQVEAVADSGWSFTNWLGDYTGSTNPTTLNINSNKNITANFSQNCDYSLTVNINPLGSGTVTKNPDKANYCPNEQVTLTASPNSGYTFSSWDGVDSNSATSASITMNANRSMSVNFSQQTLNEPDISVDPVTQVFANIPVGDSSMPQTFTISNTGSGDLVIGTLSITGDDASQFLKENDTCSGQTVTPLANCTVNVIFSPTSTGSFDSILNIPSNDLDEPNVTVNLRGRSGADITGSWISLFQKCNRANCKINGKFNVQNIGNRDALSSLVRFYLSDDGVYYEAYRFLKEAKTGTLKVGKSKSISLSYSLPSGISATDKYIIAVIDPDNTVMEANESNNIIIYGPILRANLTGMWTLLTQQCKGEKCKIRGAFNIQNTGGQDATSCFVRFYLSDDNVYDAGDTFLKQISTGTLKVGKIKKMNLNYNFLSGVSAYGKYIIAVIDADNSVLEANEGDNDIIYGPLP